MKKTPDHPAPNREPWLAHLANTPEAGVEATSADFVRRVMAAPASTQAEPWLECLALDAAAAPDALFAAQVATVFATERARRRTLRRMVLVAAELAACAALCAILFWPSALPQTPHRPVAVATESHPNQLAAALTHTAADWLSNQTKQADTSMTSVKSKTTALLAKCAVPIKASSVLLGLDIPPELQKEMDARKAEEARPGI